MPKKAKAGYSQMARSIYELLESHPEGLDIYELRKILKNSGPQQHLDRRLRELDPHFVIDRVRVGSKIVYRLKGPREAGTWDYEEISKDLRARILDMAKGRCQMCGRTINEDSVRLHIDHKIPRAWGGTTTLENLWAICSACNEGKRDFYATFSPTLMAEILTHKGVHSRIAYLLKSKLGEWIDRDLIGFVANFDDYQEDWHKRLREIRYLGFKIEVKREKQERRTVSFYRLQNWIVLAEDLGLLAKRYEAEKSKAKTDHSPFE